MNFNFGSLVFSVTITSVAGIGILYLSAKKIVENFFIKNEKKYQSQLDENLFKLKSIEDKLNLESESYVNIITKQRIEWLELVRNDLATVNSLCRAVFYHNNYAKDLKEINMFSFCIGNEQMAQSLKDSNMSFKDYFEVVKNKETEIINLVGHLTRLRLRMNPKENKTIIDILLELENKVINEKENMNIDKELKMLEILVRDMLKAEWDKVKKEIDYRGNIKNMNHNTAC